MSEIDKQSVAYKEAVFDLYSAYHRQSDHFNAMLFRLFRKAAGHNFSKLMDAYPLEGQVFKDWYNSDSESAFFDAAGVHIKGPTSNYPTGSIPNCS